MDAAGHTGMVTALDVSSCSQWAASASGDGSCLLWRIPSGTVEHKLEADSGGTAIRKPCGRVLVHLCVVNIGKGPNLAGVISSPNYD